MLKFTVLRRLAPGQKGHKATGRSQLHKAIDNRPPDKKATSGSSHKWKKTLNKYEIYYGTLLRVV